LALVERRHDLAPRAITLVTDERLLVPRRPSRFRVRSRIALVIGVSELLMLYAPRTEPMTGPAFPTTTSLTPRHNTTTSSPPWHALSRMLVIRTVGTVAIVTDGPW